MKNCLREYLTDKCCDCSFWVDGADGRGIGCAVPFPIMECPAFAKMYEEEQKSMEADAESHSTA